MATRASAPWRMVTHIDVRDRCYWLLLECGHFKSARRSVPRAFSIANKPRMAPRKVRCHFCPGGALAKAFAAVQRGLDA